ncbi:hypothetical protein EYC54_22280 [Xanthomonas oryzae]|uniref:hypothetical protein n=1 Tax=Xanthomonas oryzae TaxID=347 RepID=UPI00103345E9|nr:hypothetical protein [Xanthomonas oryzae]QBG89848.1 hypothetical protein EYC54_22280 [Xanthomonas oryzae]QBH02357.1 hypothetical protein EYC57_01340 [Xanthomonas oryzae]
MNKINKILRLCAVPLSSGVASVVFFMTPMLWVKDKYYHGFHDIIGFSIFFGLIGAFFGVLVGCPIVLLVDWKLSRSKYRYIFSAMLGALLGWLLLEGAFARNAWNSIWASSIFWFKYAPGKIFAYSSIGLLSGLIYTAFVHLVNKSYPEVEGRCE